MPHRNGYRMGFSGKLLKTVFYSRSPVYMEGHLELLHYFRQQSICDNYHRYGNLGERGELK